MIPPAPATATSDATPATSSPSASPSPSPTAAIPAPPTPTPPAVAIVTPAASATAVPAPSGGPVQPLIQAPPSVGVGESFRLHVYAPGAASVSIEFNGGTYTAAPSGERFWLVLGAPLSASPGPRTIRAIARSASGAVLGATAAPLEFTFVPRPVDYLELTEEQGSVLTEEAGRLATRAPRRAVRPVRPAAALDGRLPAPLCSGPRPPPSVRAARSTAVRLAASTAAWTSLPTSASPCAPRPAGAGLLGRRDADSRSLGHHRFLCAGREVRLPPPRRHACHGRLTRRRGRLSSVPPAQTGLSTGPHLHWEVTVWGVNVDPLQWTTASFEP